MYEEYYGFTEKPFSLTPDPKYLFKSASHANAFELLQYAVRRREGFVVITGDIGTGKTTLCRAVLEQLDRKTFTALDPEPVPVRRGSAAADPAGLRRRVARRDQARPAGGRQQAGADRDAERRSCCRCSRWAQARCSSSTKRRTCRCRCSSRSASCRTWRPTRRSCCRSSSSGSRT